MIEEWRSISWATRYEVSSLGNVRSLDGTDALGRPRKGKPINAFRDGKKGYLAVDIQGQRIKVHRLVCEAFHGPHPEDKPHVNHLDGRRENNAASNLVWCNPTENSLHSYATLGRIGSGGHAGKLGAHHHSSKAVIARHTLTGEEIRFGGVQEATRQLGMSGGSVSRCCNGHQASSKGWTFRYEEALA